MLSDKFASEQFKKSIFYISLSLVWSELMGWLEVNFTIFSGVNPRSIRTFIYTQFFVFQYTISVRMSVQLEFIETIPLNVPLSN